jgi:DNA-binding transcriptional regulator YiaG
LTGHELKAVRKRLGLMQKDLASLLGVTMAAVSKWELDQRKIPRHVELTLESVPPREMKKRKNKPGEKHE